MSAKQTFPNYQAGSGWNALLPKRNPRRQPPTDRSFDAIVIGAGVTGVAAARRIAELQPYAKVLLLDAETVGEASAGRNSGFLINLPHNTGMSGHGSRTDVARKQIALYNEGLVWLKSLIDRHQIDCNWSPVGKYHAAATAAGEVNLQQVLRQYDQWGVEHSELNRDELESCLGTPYYRYGYHSYNNVFVQPATLIRGLVDSLPENVFLWECEPVIKVHKGNPHRVITRNAEVTSPKIVIANNGFARKLGFANDRVFTIYTYAGFTPTLDEEFHKLGKHTEWGVIPANRLGTTLRKVNSGRLMIRSAYSYETEQPMEQVRGLLEDCYKRRYPQMKSHTLEYIWGGVTALTRNGALYFGEIESGIYISIGCNGAGLLKGSVFGKLLGEMACNVESTALASALGFQRPTWLPPEPFRGIAVRGVIRYQKHKAGNER